MKMQYIKITMLMVGFSLAINANALTTQEIVNRALPSVVAILPYNDNTKKSFEATGWFISNNRIVTNSHVITGDYTGVNIINVATGQKYTVDHVSYNNVATDVAVITVIESNSTYLGLSMLGMVPAKGTDVVIIGNPKEQYGKVTEGILGGTTNSAPDKNESGTMVMATVIGGNSGSPVLDPNGDVVGMIWGSTDKVNGGNGLAVNIQTLTLANLDSVDLNLGRIVGNAPAPSSPTETKAEDSLVVPKTFGSTRQGNTYTFTRVLDQDGIVAVALPVVAYIQRSMKGEVYAGCFFQTIHEFFDKKDITYAEAKAIDDAYNQKWVKRSIKIDYEGIIVEQVNWSGNPTYMVSVPIAWNVTDKHGKTRTGSGWTTAYVRPGKYADDSGKLGYFIGSIWMVANK